jgi:uncharacterized protein DUF4232
VVRLRLFALVSMVLFTCGCAALARQAGGRSPGPVSQATPVPWASDSPGGILLPTPTPTPIPAGTPSCRASDLVAVFGGIAAATGGQLDASILLGNRSAAACVVESVPQVQLFDEAGHQIPIGAAQSQGEPSDAVLIQAGTGDIQPHVERAGVAYIAMEWATHDGTGNPCVPTPPQATAIAVVLPAGGGSLRVAVSDAMSRLNVIAPCYSRLSVSPFQAWPAPEPSPTPSPLSLLAIRIDTPPSVAAGSVLHYTVRLDNVGKDPVVFSAICPIYIEWAASSSGAFAKELHVLNCAPVGNIAPGASVAFAMEISVPRTAAGGYTLVWRFVAPGDFSEPTGTAVLRVIR